VTVSIGLRSREARVGCKNNWAEPELAGHSFALHVDVFWLIAMEAIEKKRYGPGNPANGWHATRELLRDGSILSSPYPTRGRAS
jgi:hypothetical protein